MPKIEQDRLPRARPQARRRRHWTVGVADVLAVGDKIVVLFNDRSGFFVAVGAPDFVVNGVGAEVHQMTNLEPFFGKPGRSRDVEYRIRVCEQRFRLGSAQPEPFIVRVAAPVSPAIFQPEAFADAR